MPKDFAKKFEPQFGREYETFLELMGLLRKEILSMNLTQQENRTIFENLVDSEILSYLKSDDWVAVKKCLFNILPENQDLENVVIAFEKSLRK